MAESSDQAATAGSTLPTSETDTLDGSFRTRSVVQSEPDSKEALLLEKEEENRRLRDEIQENQQHLNSLRDKVKKLVEMDRIRSRMEAQQSLSSEPTSNVMGMEDFFASLQEEADQERNEDLDDSDEIVSTMNSDDEDGQTESESEQEEESQQRERNQPSAVDNGTISALHVSFRSGQARPGQAAATPEPPRSPQSVPKTSIHSSRCDKDQSQKVDKCSALDQEAMDASNKVAVSTKTSEELDIKPAEPKTRSSKSKLFQCLRNLCCMFRHSQEARKSSELSTKEQAESRTMEFERKSC